MSHTTLNAVAPVSTPVAVVANPSINVAELKSRANVVTSKKSSKLKAIDELKSMETTRISWETTELAASNNRLYSILQQAYGFYLVMKRSQDKDTRQKQSSALDAFIKERNYIFTPSTHDMTRVVKCVFGVNRRRVSAYSIALREALRQDIDVNDLIEFLEDNGGVEQIRMGGTKPLSTTKKAELGKSVLGDSVISTIKFNSKELATDADWVDKKVVFVATYLPTGEFEVNVVIKHDGVVNTAMAAYYTQLEAKKRDALREDAKAVADADKAEKERSKAQALAVAKAEKLKQQAAEAERVAKELAAKEKAEA